MDEEIGGKGAIIYLIMSQHLRSKDSGDSYYEISPR